MEITPSPETDPAPGPVTTPRGAALRARRGRRARLGTWGEDVAAGYLRSLGWRILARNWACELGEVDIVAIEPGVSPAVPDTLVLVEVKCRSGTGYGDPLEAITVAKVRKLRSLALAWLSASPRPVPRIRLDAVGVERLAGRPPAVTHVRGIS